MTVSLKIFNYAALVVLGIAVIKLGLMGPGLAFPAALNLLPFGVAIIAAMPESRPLSAKFAVILNIFWAALVSVALLLMLGRRITDFLWVAAFCVPIALICILNVRSLWPQAFRKRRA